MLCILYFKKQKKGRLGLVKIVNMKIAHFYAKNNNINGGYMPAVFLEISRISSFADNREPDVFLAFFFFGQPGDRTARNELIWNPDVSNILLMCKKPFHHRYGRFRDSGKILFAGSQRRRLYGGERLDFPCNAGKILRNPQMQFF